MNNKISMAYFIKLLESLKAECKKRDRHTYGEACCEECEYRKKCNALYDLSESLYEDLPEDFYMEKIKNSLKVLGYEDD